MQIQLLRQTQGRPVGGHPVIQRPARQAATPLGRPHRRVLRPGQQRPHRLQILRHRLHRPRKDAQHGTPPRRAAPHRLAVPHMQRPEPAQPGRRRVRVPIGHIQHHRLPAPQPPPVDHLQRHRVPKRRHRPLPPAGHGLPHLGVGVVEQRLQLLPRQRPPPRAALIVGRMQRAVRLGAHLHRMCGEPLPALLRPAVAGVGDEVTEQPQPHLIGPQRGPAEPLRAQLCPELLHIGRRPRPRIVVGERGEPAHRLHLRRDRVLRQQASQLLAGPPGQHRLEHRLLRIQMPHPRDQH